MLDRVLIVDDNAALTNTATSSSELPGFPDGAYWEVLLPQSAPVEEPTNAFQPVHPQCQRRTISIFLRNTILTLPLRGKPLLGR
eukprot:11445181-Ditylum_brightwellii.AAC.1